MADSSHHSKPSHLEMNRDSIASLKKQRLHFFSVYTELPDGIVYENQEDDEHILVMLRRHWVTNIPWITFSLLLSLLPFLLSPFLSSFEGVLFDFSLPLSYILILTSFYYLIVLGFALLNFISWFYNISIVTNNEVVDIDYANVTYKDIASTNLREIQDVEYEQKGFIQTFFNYGDVFIQTAGAHPNLEFLRVPKPSKVNDIIMDEKRKVVGHE